MSTVSQITVTDVSTISVVTAGTQGVAGPNTILGRSVITSTAGTAGSLLVYDHANLQWEDSQSTRSQSLTAKLFNLGFTSGGSVVTGVLDEDNMGSNSNTKLATQQSIKSYVDVQNAAQAINFQGDTGGNQSVTINTEVLNITGGTGLDTVGSSNTVTINIDSTVATLTGTQTLTNKTLTSPVLNTVDINAGDISSDTVINKSPTITLAGDLSGNATLSQLGNATLTATIVANSVALGTDTTGNYVATIAAGEGIDVSGSGSETAGVTITAETATDSNLGVASFNSTDFSVSSGAVTLVTERIQDIVGAMTTSNTESGIAVTYQDSDGTIDFDVADFDITLTGDVTGSGTVTNLGDVSFAATIQANSVALGTDTTGNYVATIAQSNTGIDVANSGSETAGVTLGLNTEHVQDLVGAMFSSNTESGIAVTYQDDDGTIDLNVADPTITLSGDVAGSATMTNLGDVTISTTIQANSIALGTDTTGNYIATVAAGEGIDVANSGSESAAITISAEDATTSNKGVASFDGTDFSVSSGAVTVNAERIQDIVGAMVGSNTESGISVTYEDGDGTLDFNVNDPTLTFTGDVTGSGTMTDLGNTSIALTVAANSVALGTDTTGNYVSTISGTSNEIEVSGSGSETAGVTVGLPDNVTIGGNLVVTGNFTVNGTETTINTATLDVEDLTIRVGKNATSLANTNGAGIEFGASTSKPTITWDNSNSRLTSNKPFHSASLVGAVTGNASTATTLETARNIHGVSFNGSADIDLSEVISDTVGAMFGSNTETGITATYQDADNTIDLVIGAGDITNGMLAGSIANAKLSNSAITVSDGSNTTAVALGGTITYAAGEGLDVAESSGTVTYSAEDATASNKGVASFTNHFSVSSGAVSLANSGVSAAAYGSSTAIPVITIDAQGRITNATTASINTNFTLAADSGSNDTFSTGGTLTFTGGEGIDTTVSNDTITIAAELATETNAGVATFDGTDFSVSSGDVTINVERISDIVGGMVGSNTETGISVAYQDADNTLDFVLATAQPTVTSLGTLTGLTVSGDVTFTGAATNIVFDKSDNALEFADDSKAIFGTGGDLEIYHDGSNSFIKEAGTGNLKINADSLHIKNASDDELKAYFDTNGAVGLYHDNVQKFVTTSTGISITGEVAATSLDISGDVDIDGTLEADAITVNGTTLAETIADTVGAMVGSNTESGITVAYQDSDNTLDFTVGTLNQDTTGTAALATTVTISANNSGNENIFPVFVDGATGTQGLETDTGLTYNPSTGLMTATGFSGALTGTLQTAAQANVTSLGTLTSLAVTGDVAVNTNVLKVDTSNNRVGIKTASPSYSLDAGSATDAFFVPKGTTAQRPSAAAGLFRYNTSLSRFEGYTDAWGEIGGGGSNTFTVDNYTTADNSTTAFTLSQTPNSEDNLMVFVGGVFQNPNDYVLNGTTLTLDEAPPSGTRIIVYSVRAAVSGSNLNTDQFTCNGGSGNLGVNFTLSIAPVSENNTQVFLDGVYQQKTDYSVSGTTLTMDTAPTSGAILEVMTFTQTDINVPVNDTIKASHLNTDIISGLTEVTAVSGDKMMILDATDSALKKTDVNTLMATAVSISSSADAVALTFDSNENATFAGSVTAAGNIAQTTGDYLYSGGGNFDIKHSTASQNIVFSTTPSGGSTAEVLRITHDGKLSKLSGDLTLDVAGDIILDAGGQNIYFDDDGTRFLSISQVSNDVYIGAEAQDKDIIFRGNDNGSTITALTLDMSEGGSATFNKDVLLSDNSALRLGTGQDLALFHDATDSHIRNTQNNGVLRIRSSETYFLNADNNETQAKFIENGAVELYHDNVKKFETTSDGISVSGLSVLTSNTPIITFTESDQSNKTFKIGSFGAAFAVYDESNSQFRYIIDTNGNHIFNEGSADVDFRVESNGNENMLFVDGTNNRVGIGKVPAQTLSVDASGGANLFVSRTGQTGGLYIESDGTNGVIRNPADNPILLQVNGANTQVTINSNKAHFLRPITQGGHTGSAAGIGASLGDVNGSELGPGYLTLARDDTADSAQLMFLKNGNLHSKIITVSNQLKIHNEGADIHFMTSEGGTARRINFSGSSGFKPFDSNDNHISLGTSGARWTQLFAATSTIGTSDRNEKQNEAAISAAEKRVAIAAKGLLKKFKFKDAVKEKGSDARIHFGIIAQDLQDAFNAEGLDASDYAMWCSDTWTDEDTGQSKTRLGIRYEELLAFIIAGM